MNRHTSHDSYMTERTRGNLCRNHLDGLTAGRRARVDVRRVERHQELETLKRVDRKVQGETQWHILLSNHPSPFSLPEQKVIIKSPPLCIQLPHISNPHFEKWHTFIVMCRDNCVTKHHLSYPIQHKLLLYTGATGLVKTVGWAWLELNIVEPPCVVIVAGAKEQVQPTSFHSEQS